MKLGTVQLGSNLSSCPFDKAYLDARPRLMMMRDVLVFLPGIVVLVLLGPGAGLGGAIGQVLSRMRWRGIDSKAAFAQAQRSDRPALITLPPAGAAPAAEAAEERPLAINE